MLYPSDTQVVEIMKSTSSCKLLVYLWLDHPGQVTSLIFCRFLCKLSVTSHILSFPLQTIFNVLSLIFFFANCLRCLIFFSAANDFAEGGRQEEEEGRRQDGVLRLSCLPRRAHGRNTLKYFAFCPNTCFYAHASFLRRPFNILSFAQTPVHV